MLQGVDYDVAAWSRSDAYLTLLPAINTPGKIELLDNSRLIAAMVIRKPGAKAHHLEPSLERQLACERFG
jgi:hypothetical protein